MKINKLQNINFNKQTLLEFYISKGHSTKQFKNKLDEYLNYLKFNFNFNNLNKELNQKQLNYLLKLFEVSETDLDDLIIGDILKGDKNKHE